MVTQPAPSIRLQICSMSAAPLKHAQQQDLRVEDAQRAPCALALQHRKQPAEQQVSLEAQVHSGNSVIHSSANVPICCHQPASQPASLPTSQLMALTRPQYCTPGTRRLARKARSLPRYTGKKPSGLGPGPSHPSGAGAICTVEHGMCRLHGMCQMQVAWEAQYHRLASAAAQLATLQGSREQRDS